MSALPATLIFDLDGTLIHSAPDLHVALNRVLTKHGRDAVTLHQVTQMIGDGVAILLARGFDATGGPPDNPAVALESFHEFYGEDAATLTSVYPGVVETLETLAQNGHRMGVCTNKPLTPALAVLKSFDLFRFFDAVSGGDSFPVRKPSPGHLTGTLAMMDRGTENAVMIGDSPNDVATALNAAVPAIAVAYGYRRVPAEALGADILIESFDELPAALTRLGV